ncbi:MAG: tripartite tricarboxylate transporter substrate binding protein [Rhodocyclaceae bacterium]|nr:tripartite tricarboxylate transporter substrate binding protein [Rhodocyclaceae bacterium]MCA3074759.1 tripartite tricarboxylate transporter substrate binding protein [Rhodocyclaceae bacterium]MCA3091615.1 tripartite tricarboxylate transporter substrate binding protein [Rhodocyclaceae bacterium]MCA3093967.1 tripartite tricarboxylate transporter substrate binding protein [Rhodocyclaceae bacterium]MCA3099242.1 tripartite tricarboxylate transporter substrate binding protein [Rhodocyclaceae bact
MPAVGLALFGATAGCTAPSAIAADAPAFPTRPLRMVVPFPAGGNVDYVARVLGQGLEKGLGQPVVVDNRPGAQGVLGVQIGAQAAADGHTLTVSDAATVIAPAMMDKAPFDVLRDFVPVGALIEQPYVVAINASVPAATLAEFVKLAQANPGKLNFGSGAAIGHVSQELFFAVAGIRLTHVPYRGAPQLMGALLANEVQVTFTGPGLALPQVRNGKLRALAVTTRSRAREMPDVPTIEEQGYKGFEIRGWYGLLAPAGTPQALVARLNTAVNTVLTSPQAAQTLRERGFEPLALSPAAFGAMLKAEIVRWSQAIRTYNVKQQSN